MKSLVVVESPAKAKTINKYLGKDYTVLASFGHIRELPSKEGSVDTNTFDLKYQVDKKSSKHVKALVDEMKQCDKLILATDPDREGEAIAWHIAEVLKDKKVLKKTTPIERVVFNAITKDVVLKAIKEPRELDNNLISAQQARRALDYLFGFTLSPVLWRKLPGSKSAGRVQSVALRLICERNEEIINFKTQEYWSINALFKTNEKKDLIAKLIEFNSKKIEKLTIKNEKEAIKIKQILLKETFSVSKIESKETKRNPFAPFTTSTLQQEAAKKFGFNTKKTMQVAQKLYEGIDTGNGAQGLITYMRTDGVYITPEAITETRNVISKNYGEKYLPTKAIKYENKVKNAQEAHEAIRPTNPKTKPNDIKDFLSNDEFKLYDLIWKRLIASQMNPVILDQMTIEIKTENNNILKSTGSCIKFDGFYVLYNETNEDSIEEKDEILPKVQLKENLNLQNIIDKQHFTEPPAKYTEAGLVKKMEEIGIGRPSTYASIISVLQEREYVKLEKKKFIPENRGIVVNSFLKLFFPNYVEYNYTAQLENDLDTISNGNKEWKLFLKEFWAPLKEETENVLKIENKEILSRINEVLGKMIFGYDEKGNLKNKCPDCENGILNIRTGKFGIFIACNNYPDCKYTEKIINETNNIDNNDMDNEKDKENRFENKLLAVLDDKNVYLKKGPYGFYVQLGEDSEKPKPKRVGLPKNYTIENFDFNQAKNFLNLPKVIGKHPEDNGDIKVNIGPYGPYLMWNKKFFSIKKDNLFEIDITRALEIMSKLEFKKK